MAADVLFYSKAHGRLRIIPEADYFVRDGVTHGLNLAELEAGARCVFEHERNGGPDPGIGAKAETCSVLVLVELICQRFAGEEIGRFRIETAPGINVQMQCRRKEQVNVF